MKLLVAALLLFALARAIPISERISSLNEFTAFSLQQIHLIDSVHSPSLAGQQLNQAYLDLLPIDRLLYTYNRNANLSVDGIAPLGGWESPESDIRGVFLAFYLQASVKAYLTYNNTQQLLKAQRLVSQLYTVQTVLNESGFLAAWPSEHLRKLERLEKVWAPIYCYEKLLRGLSDMFYLAGFALAEPMMQGMIDYLYAWMVHCANTYSVSHWHTMIFSTTDYEYGGISEFFYERYGLTGDRRLFWMAQQFDDGQFLGALSLGADFLTGLHANSHVPAVLGSGRRYAITGEQQYRAILENFYSLVWNNHSYATGGSTGGNGSTGFYQQEHYSDPNLLSQTLWNNNQEFCVQYNMLKLIRLLIEWTGRVEYANAYERVFVNSIWGTQDPAEPGHMLYSYPLGEGVSKPAAVSSGGIGYGSPFDSFWCCYTTAIDQWTKMGDSIYFYRSEDAVPSLYVNLFVASQLDWHPHHDVWIRQTTAFPREATTTLTVSTNTTSVQMNIYLRVPSWIVPNESWITINDVRERVEWLPSSYVFLTRRQWQHNDQIVYRLGMRVYSEPIKDDPKLVSILFGPVVLGGLINQAKVLPRNMARIRQVNTTVHESLHFRATALDGSAISLLPLYEIVNQTYTVYFRTD